MVVAVVADMQDLTLEATYLQLMFAVHVVFSQERWQ